MQEKHHTQKKSGSVHSGIFEEIKQ